MSVRSTIVERAMDGGREPIAGDESVANRTQSTCGHADCGALRTSADNR